MKKRTSKFNWLMRFIQGRAWGKDIELLMRLALDKIKKIKKITKSY